MYPVEAITEILENTDSVLEKNAIQPNHGRK